MTSTRASALAVLALLAACSAEDLEAARVLTELDAGTAVSVQVVGAVGGSPLRVPVRLVNELGAAIPGGTITLSVDGPTATLGEATVSVSGTGYGFIDVTTAAPETFTVTAVASSDDASVGGGAIGQVVGAPFPAFGINRGNMLPTFESEPTFTTAGTGGVAVAVANTVWWVPSGPGVPAHSVLDLPFDITGMVGAHIDADGLLDLVVWGGTDVVGLRGQAGGGYAWGAGWESNGAEVVGVAARDLDGDRLTDIAVGASGDLQATVEVLLGDGSWGFTSEAPLELNHEIFSLSASDDASDGRPDIAVIDAANGFIRRYTLSPEGWAGAATFELSAYSAPEGSRLLPDADLDGNGSNETSVVGIPEAGAQDWVFYVTDDVTTHYPLAFDPFYPAMADINGDSTVDILALQEDGVLQLVIWDGEQFTRTSINDLEYGPVAAGDFTGDAVDDVGVVTDALLLYQGSLDGIDWSPDSFANISYSVVSQGPIGSADVNGDGYSDIIGHRDNGGVTELVAWLLTPNDSGTMDITLGRAVTVGDNADVYGLVQCGESWYSLVGTGAGQTLSRFEMGVGGGSYGPIKMAGGAVNGTLVGCGTADNGSPGAVVSTPAGSWSTWSESITAISSGSLSSAVEGVGLADSDGDGDGEVFGCSDAGCNVLSVDLDGDGIDEVISGGSQVQLLADGATTTLAGQGRLSLGDVDGDGQTDVLALDAATGRTYAWRNAGGSLTPPVVLHTNRSVFGAAVLADTTADGIPEIIYQDPDGNLLQTGATTPGVW